MPRFTYPLTLVLFGELNIFSFCFVACGLNTTVTPLTAMNGSSGGVGDGVPCIPNGNAAIKFLGFKEVTEHQMTVFII